MILRLAALACLLALLPALGSGYARAQSGAEALGTPLGSFVLFPSLTIGAEYDDNIFATENNEEDDVIFIVTPEVRLSSDWDNHALEFSSNVTFNEYADNTNESVTDYSFLGGGRLDIHRDTFATLDLGYIKNHEDRGSPDDVNGRDPVEFRTIGGALGLNHQFNRFWVNLSNDVKHFDFSDVDAVGGGQINNDDRNRIVYSVVGEFGYEFNPEVGLFLRTNYNLEDYDDTPDDNGFDRNQYNYGLSGGIRLDVTNVIFGQVFGGVGRSEFDDSAFDTQTNFIMGGSLTWLATPLTTATLGLSRGWEQTTVAGASSEFTTTVDAGVDHSLLDNLTLGANVGYSRGEFEDTNRVDDTLSFGPSLTYLMNRFVHLNLDYTRTQRWSDAPGQDYTQNSVLLSLRLQY